MDQPRDEPEVLESTPLETEAPMDIQLVQNIRQETEPFASKTLCVHGRLIDDVRTRSGTPTGKVRCLECGTIFHDPHRSLD
jgi:hypothetical protein